MLTSDLLRTRTEGPYLYPRHIKVDTPRFTKMAQELIAIYADYEGKPRRALTTTLNQYAEDRTDFRIQRGMATILHDHPCEFEEHSIAPSAEIRRRLFALAHENHPVVLQPDLIHPVTKDKLLTEVAREHKAVPKQIAWAQYIDLAEEHILTRFDTPDPQWLLLRYNVVLAQALLYRCIRMKLSVFRNIPSRHTQLFKFTKFYQLMHAIEGDLDGGHVILLDGPVSMFRLSQKYGLKLAVFLPPLLLCTRWKMEAEILTSDGEHRYFPLDECANLVSHYRDSTMYDSLLEKTFAERFIPIDSGRPIAREVAIINLKQTLFILDFAFRHTDGRTALMEIVGCWHPEYLEKSS